MPNAPVTVWFETKLPLDSVRPDAFGEGDVVEPLASEGEVGDSGSVQPAEDLLEDFRRQMVERGGGGPVVDDALETPVDHDRRRTSARKGSAGSRRRRRRFRRRRGFFIFVVFPIVHRRRSFLHRIARRRVGIAL